MLSTFSHFSSTTSVFHAFFLECCILGIDFCPLYFPVIWCHPFFSSQYVYEPQKKYCRCKISFYWTHCLIFLLPPAESLENAQQHTSRTQRIKRRRVDVSIVFKITNPLDDERKKVIITLISPLTIYLLSWNSKT